MMQVLAGLVAASLSAAPPSFPDVPRSHWASRAIQHSTALGLFEGRPDGRFDGKSPVTRYELAVVMARLLERFGFESSRPVKSEPVTIEFPDVPRKHWASAALVLCASSGFFEGLPSGSFGGDLPAARYATAHLFFYAADYFGRKLGDSHRIYNSPEEIPTPNPVTVNQAYADLSKPLFVDLREKHWAYSSANHLTAMGIFEGCPDDRFHGERPVTRYELAAIVARLHERGAMFRAKKAERERRGQ